MKIHSFKMKYNADHNSLNKTSKIAKGYIRVSTEMQKEEGISLETQVKLIQRHCDYKNFELVKIYEDAGISGKNIIDRPGLQDLISSLQRGDSLIICTLCRLSRDTRNLLNLIDHFKIKGVNFICLEPELDTSTPIGMAVLTILSVMKQLERETISKNVSINMQRLSQENKLRSRAPFGYRFVSKNLDFESIPEQQEVIEIIIHNHCFGHTPSKIATILNESGYGQTLNLNKNKPRPDPKFFPETVKRILQEHGYIDTKGKIIDERIVSFRKIT